MDTISKEIKRVKIRLIRKARKNGLYENFGRREVRKLTDMFGYCGEVKDFDNWCMNLSDRDLVEE